MSGYTLSHTFGPNCRILTAGCPNSSSNECSFAQWAEAVAVNEGIPPAGASFTVLNVPLPAPPNPWLSSLDMRVSVAARGVRSQYVRRKRDFCWHRLTVT